MDSSKQICLLFRCRNPLVVCKRERDLGQGKKRGGKGLRKRSGRRKERGLREWPFIVQRPFFRQTAAAFSGENDVGGDDKFVTFLLSNVSLNRLRSDFRQGFISFPFLPEADVER